MKRGVDWQKSTKQLGLTKVNTKYCFQKIDHNFVTNSKLFCHVHKMVRNLCLLNPNFLKYYAFNLYENKNGFSTANGDFSHCLSGIPFMFEVTLN